ncbi:UDP-N-acetylmuramoyl-L-alanyl-D-glutamate--2,6-diaminopimelate ligase [Virgibacillus sediminis]|uniref:UDP-N-acetylmuramyl-tripeptide synthetase n=1 Tax=Virgibacillus sediminis TaxID=202260 RepID=A0ABV7A9N2_9BACI
MKLTQLLNGLEKKNQISVDTEQLKIKGLADSSADVAANYIFVAISGFRSDGHDFINDAIDKGACLIIGEQGLSGLPVPYIQVENSRKALGILAKNFYGDPAEKKWMIGVTGTNGKTTTSYLLKHILEDNGHSCAVIGTIQNIINGEARKSSNTTPSSLEMHRMLAESRDDTAIVEVSSHGLSQFRVEGVQFDLCLFTNLHPEHLDYHRTMDNYFQAKKSLFDHLKVNGCAIVNTDNEWGSKLANLLEEQGKTVYATGKSAQSSIRIHGFNTDASTITLEENGKTDLICSPILGVHNMYNTISAYTAAILSGISKEDVRESLLRFDGIDGRFEINTLPEGQKIIIDYAHTPDAIDNCLNTAKDCGAKRIIHVFGFRGDRDISKREEMLRLSASLSDQYVLTLDDLNSVSYNEMVDTLRQLQSDQGNQKGTVLPDRTLAIKQAIEQSEPGDWVIITGKGHEAYQQSYSMNTTSDKETVCHITRTLDNIRLDAVY